MPLGGRRNIRREYPGSNLILEMLRRDHFVRSITDNFRFLDAYIREYVKEDCCEYPGTEYYYIYKLLATLLVPGLLAYRSYVRKEEVFFAKDISALRHRNQDLHPHLTNLCSDIEEVLASFERHLSETRNRRYQEVTASWKYFERSMKQRVLDRTTAFTAGRKLPNHSFWNLCCLYYRVLHGEKNCNLIVKPTAEWYFAKYSPAGLGELKKFISSNLNAFRKKHGAINNEPQYLMPQIPLVSTGDARHMASSYALEEPGLTPSPSSANQRSRLTASGPGFLRPHGAHWEEIRERITNGDRFEIHPVEFAITCDLSNENIIAIGKELRFDSYTLDAWEQLLYWDNTPGKEGFYYIPYFWAQAFKIFQCYTPLFNLQHAEPEPVAQYRCDAIKSVIKDVHFFLKGLYEEDNATYTTAGRLLGRIRKENRHALISAAGANIWQVSKGAAQTTNYEIQVYTATTAPHNSFSRQLRSFPKINEYVRHYVSDHYSKIESENPLLLPILGKSILRVLIAYEAYNFELDAFYPKGLLTWRTRHVKKDIGSKLNAVFAVIEEALPQYGSISDLTTFDANLHRLVEARIVNSRHNMHYHAFGTLCGLMFHTYNTKNTGHLPTAGDKFYLQPYSPERLTDLMSYCRRVVNEFCQQNRACNAADQHLMPNAYPENYQAWQYVKDKGRPEYEIGLVYKNSFINSLGVEFYENLSYWNPIDERFDFLPHHVMAAYSTLGAYSVFQRLVAADVVEPNELNEQLNNICNLFVDSLYLTMRGIYDLDGNVTDAAKVVLNCLRIDKTHSRSRVVTVRGYNIWQKNIRENKILDRRPQFGPFY